MGLARRPQWRQELAAEYAQSAKKFEDVKFAEGEDKLVVKLAEYFFLARQYTPQSRKKRENNFAVLHEAYEIFLREDDFGPKWLIEALAVGGLPSPDISHYTGIAPNIVEVYCRCFFDMCDIGIRERYIRNIRGLCTGRRSLRYVNYGWKLMVAAYGVEMFSHAILNPHLLTDEESRIIQKAKCTMGSVGAWWKLTKSSMSMDREVNEIDLMQERQSVDVDLAYNKASVSGNGKELNEVVEELISPARSAVGMQEDGEENLPAKEERLTKKS